MRVLVDALCAEYGGIRTYAEGLLSAWSEAFSEDEVHVAVRSGSALATPGLIRHDVGVRRPEVVGRPLSQATSVHRLSTSLRPDVILNTATATDPRRTASPMVVVVYDLRSDLRPEQFSAGRRLLRRVSYERSYALADGFVAISRRSLDDLRRLHPSTGDRPATVAHLGADHVRGWPAARRDGPAVAFAHHTNKNPDLVIEAWSRLAHSGERRPLLLLGVAGDLRERLTLLVRRLDLEGLVTLAPFLPDREFRRAIAEADMIVFPSDFEGFGLPVVEGMAMGKPVVVGPDPASLEVAGGHAFTSEDFSADGVAEAVRRAGAATAAQLAAATRWADSFTWEACLGQTRSLLESVAGAAR